MKRTSYDAPHDAVFSSSPHFLSLRSKYSPQHPVLRNSQSIFFPTVSQPYKTIGKIIVLIFKFLERHEDKRI
jgi:hypothetical protein